MKIRMKTLASGPAGVFLAEKIYASPHDLTDEQAHAFIEGGYAEEVADQAISDEVIETADAPVEPVELAVPAAPKPRRPRGSKADLKE